MDMPDRQNTEQKKPTPSLPQNSKRLRWLLWLIMMALTAWNVWTFLRSSPTEIEIPYTTFLTQVREANVTSVQIAGDQITGQLAHGLVWPEPTPEATPAAAGVAGTPSALISTSQPNTSTYTLFNTTFPEVVGDRSLMPLLQSHDVMIVATPSSTPWFVILLTDGFPFLLLVVGLVWMARQAGRTQLGVFNFGRSRPRLYSGDGSGDRPSVTFDDVAGADEAKADLQQVVDFLRQPQKYHELGARIPRGVLLVGPPGTGKTLLARAVAGEAEVPYFSISASEFVEMFVGVGASRVRNLFEQAKAASPAILFIDELDAVGRRRGTGLGTVNDEREQTLNQLLVAMDGFDGRQEVVVLAATNRPDVLDPALLRPGRFDRQVVVSLPDRRGRAGILRIHTRKLSLASNVDIGLLARTTSGFSGADLANLCNEAALVAAQRNQHMVSMADFEEALDRVLLGGKRPLLLDEQERRVVAYHEAGHALVAWLSAAADPVYKVTIIPHGQALGVTEQVPDSDRYNYGRTYLLARLAVMLGGRAAEELALVEITTGAENDLVEATRLARRMVTRWGMGSLGLAAFESDDEQPFLGYELSRGRNYGEDTANRIDTDIRSLLTERFECARQLLAEHRAQLDSVVLKLLQEETVNRHALERILGPRPEASPGEVTVVPKVEEGVATHAA